MFTLITREEIEVCVWPMEVKNLCMWVGRTKWLTVGHDQDLDPDSGSGSKLIKIGFSTVWLSDVMTPDVTTESN